MTPERALEPGSVVADKLEVVRLIGEGGMGAVYEVVHRITKHHRAMKVLHAAHGATPDAVERFFREASAAGRIGNPHIAETFDAGTLPAGDPFLVMELLRGETLAERIERGPLELREIVDLLTQACDGIEAAHAAGIIHRDLKPENLFIAEREGKPFLKVLDFGVSKFDSGHSSVRPLTHAGHFVGTPFYMPPEQLEGAKHVDPRADVYALGIILYECAARRKPYEAETLVHLAVLVHEGAPEPLAKVRPDLPAGFAEAVALAMHKDPAKRFSSARELANALSGLIGVAAPAAAAAPESAPTLVSEPPPLPRSGLRSGTADAVVSTPQLPLSPRPRWVAAVLGVGFAGIAGALLFARGQTHDPSNAAPPSASAVTSETTPRAAGTVAQVAPLDSALPLPSASASSVSPVTEPIPHRSKEKAASSARASGSSHGDSPPAAPPPTAAPSAAPSAPDPSTSVRARSRGLVVDNPFR